MDNELHETFPAKERMKSSSKTEHFFREPININLQNNVFLNFMQLFFCFLLTNII